MEFRNDYEDPRRAAAYDELGLGGTYELAFRGLPELLAAHVKGQRALDFGCGTGRSGRFLKSLGYDVIGVDISADMVAVARERDPGGDWRVIDDGDFSSVPAASRDLVLSAFTFDNVPGRERKERIFAGLRALLAPGGRLVNIVSTPEIYLNEWVTFSTAAFPANREARAGDVVRIVTTEYSDARPVDDILWPDADYRAVYAAAGLEVLQVERPLATAGEGREWKSELAIAPWALYVLGAAAR